MASTTAAMNTTVSARSAICEIKTPTSTGTSRSYHDRRRFLASRLRVAPMFSLGTTRIALNMHWPQDCHKNHHAHWRVSGMASTRTNIFADCSGLMGQNFPKGQKWLFRSPSYLVLDLPEGHFGQVRTYCDIVPVVLTSTPLPVFNGPLKADRWRALLASLNRAVNLRTGIQVRDRPGVPYFVSERWLLPTSTVPGLSLIVKYCFHHGVTMAEKILGG